MSPGLYIVATPIGNLGDISARALEVLEGVDLIAAEDTRHTKRLLQHFDIRKQLISLHEHNEVEQADVLVDKLSAGSAIALVSDAGTPLISDPGFNVVKRVREAGLTVYAVPGPCALIAALSVSGLASHRFLFEGFIPAKGKAKREKLEEICSGFQTTIFYESSHRIGDTLSLIAELIPERSICVARELTKRFETVKTGVAKGVYDWLMADDNQSKGEFVVIVEAQESTKNTGVDQNQLALLDVLLKEMPPKKACSIVAQHYNSDKKALYQHAIVNKSS